MNCEWVLGLARNEGFEAALLPVDKIVFDANFRKYCEENLCGQYHNNYSCPPDCGTPEMMRAKALQYSNALVVKSKWENIDWHDSLAVRKAKHAHNEAMLRILLRMEENGNQGLMCGASCCSLCEKCAIQIGQPCPNPQRRFSCLSAYCINVSQLSAACQMEYGWEAGKLGLYGMILFSNQL